MQVAENETCMLGAREALQVISTPLAVVDTTIFLLRHVLQHAIHAELPEVVWAPHPVAIHEATVPDVHTLMRAKSTHNSNHSLVVSKDNEALPTDEKRSQAAHGKIL